MNQDLAAVLAQTILDASANAAVGPFTVGKVTAVAAGNATVLWRGTSIAVKRLSSYTATVNDIVLMARPTSQLVILGKIV